VAKSGHPPLAIVDGPLHQVLEIRLIEPQVAVIVCLEPVDQVPPMALPEGV
jgi:hypothetical protein